MEMVGAETCQGPQQVKMESYGDVASNLEQVAAAAAKAAAQQAAQPGLPQPAAAETGGLQKADDRFYCPYPGCNRSFAELWRLKVHYRAPPDIRGSGKERGHGTELTQCPKCGKMLKPGKHHVGCAAANKANNRQAKRRTATSGDGSTAGDIEPNAKRVAADASAAQDGTQDGAAGLARQGFVAQSWAGPDGAQAAQMQASMQRMQAMNNGQGSFQGSAVPNAGAPVMMAPSFPRAPSSEQNRFWQQGGYGAAGMQNPGAMQNPSFYQLHQPPNPAFASTFHQPQPGAVPSRPRYQPEETPQPSESGQEPHEPDFLRGIFEDVPELPRAPPSPPPLPSDFHGGAANGHSSNRMLFNFSQFNQKMPHTLPQTGRGARELTETEVLDLAEQHVVYLEEQTDDGELMQMLFGMADDVPTMATIHLHTWQNCDDDELPGMTAATGFRRISSTQALLQRAQGGSGVSAVSSAGLQRGPSPRPAMGAQPGQVQVQHSQQHHQVLQPPPNNMMQQQQQQQQQRNMMPNHHQHHQPQQQLPSQQGYPQQQQQSYDPGPQHGYGHPRMQGRYMQGSNGQLPYPGYDANGQGAAQPYMPMQGGVFSPSAYSMPGGMFSAAAVLAASQQQQGKNGGGGGAAAGGPGAGHSQNGPSAGPGGGGGERSPPDTGTQLSSQQQNHQQSGTQQDGSIQQQHQQHQQQHQQQSGMQQPNGKAMYMDPNLPSTCGDERDHLAHEDAFQLQFVQPVE